MTTIAGVNKATDKSLFVLRRDEKCSHFEDDITPQKCALSYQAGSTELVDYCADARAYYLSRTNVTGTGIHIPTTAPS